MTAEEEEHIAKGRGEALRLRTRLYRGRPCKHGHDGPRYTANSNCVACIRHRRRKRYARAHPERAEYRRRLP